LLNFLADQLDPQQAAQTTVVFDAASAPPGLPRQMDHRGLKVCFAVQHESADALIEELIRADFTPRQLTVVSSDHRIQRAARRRKARAVDSEAWFDELLRRQLSPPRPEAAAPAKPNGPLAAAEVELWLSRFGGESVLQSLVDRESVQETRSRSARSARRRDGTSPDDAHSDKPTPSEAGDLANPFPPGYAEELEDEMDDLDPGPEPPHGKPEP
jgi:hypothetical protein